MKKPIALLGAFVLMFSLVGFAADTPNDEARTGTGIQNEHEDKHDFSWRDLFIYES